MKIYISADIEGIAGVTDLDHTRREGKDYESARMLMTEEVNAAVEGAFNGGASDVLVNDSHGKMINLLTENLDERVTFIAGSPKPMSMMQGVEECNAAFFIGYHSRAGTADAVMDHTYHGRVVYNIRINNEVMGEFGINASLAGYFKIPVVLVTGDKKTTDRASDLLKKVEIVTTKEGVGRFAAKNMHPVKVREEIKKKARKTVEILDQFSPFTITPPLRLEMDVLSTDMADNVVMMPGIERVSARCVSYECDDFFNLYRAMRAMILIASAGIRK